MLIADKNSHEGLVTYIIKNNLKKSEIEFGLIQD